MKEKTKLVKQLNIFNEVDLVNPEGKIIRCEVCGVSMDSERDCCSLECAEKSIEMVFGKE